MRRINSDELAVMQDELWFRNDVFFFWSVQLSWRGERCSGLAEYRAWTNPNFVNVCVCVCNFEYLCTSVCTIVLLTGYTSGYVQLNYVLV